VGGNVGGKFHSGNTHLCKIEAPIELGLSTSEASDVRKTAKGLGKILLDFQLTSSIAPTNLKVEKSLK